MAGTPQDPANASSRMTRWCETPTRSATSRTVNRSPTYKSRRRWWSILGSGVPDACLSEPPVDCPESRRAQHSELLLRPPVLEETTQLGVVNWAGPARLTATNTRGGKDLGDVLAADGQAAGYVLLRHTTAVELCHLLGIRVPLLPPASERARRRLGASVFDHLSISPAIAAGASGHWRGPQFGCFSAAGGRTVTDPGAG